MRIRALRQITVGKTKHPPGAELDMEDKWAKVHMALGSAEEVGGEVPVRRRGRPPGSKNKNMVAGGDYLRSDIQTQDEETK